MSNAELSFLGIGSAFNTQLGNNSAFIKNNKSMLLIDCGGTVFHRLRELKLFEGLENLYIVITHTHPDHVGSLGEAIFFPYYAMGLKPTVIFPEKPLLDDYLRCIGVRSEMYFLKSDCKVAFTDTCLGEMSFEFVPVSHVDTIPAYGFIMECAGKRIYYSGDASVIGQDILQRLSNGEIDRVYHDTCGLDYERNGHTSLRRLGEMVAPELRGKVYCMHQDEFLDRQQAAQMGFNMVEIYK